MLDPVAVIVSGYSGDPDTRGNRMIQSIGDINSLPIGTTLYTTSIPHLAITTPGEPENRVIITQSELDRLEARDEWLNALEAAGVDNWQGWDEARDIQDEWKRENGEET